MQAPSCLSLKNLTSAPRHQHQRESTLSCNSPCWFFFISVSQLPTESSSGEHGEVAASCLAWLDRHWIQQSQDNVNTIWQSHGDAQLFNAFLCFFWYNPAFLNDFQCIWWCATETMNAVPLGSRNFEKSTLSTHVRSTSWRNRVRLPPGHPLSSRKNVRKFSETQSSCTAHDAHM